MKQPTNLGYNNIPFVHMIGFRSKKEAVQECDRLNEAEELSLRSRTVTYFIQKTKVFQPTITQEDNND